jgi:hypothetical protein
MSIEALGVMPDLLVSPRPNPPASGRHSRDYLFSCAGYAERVIGIPLMGVATWLAFAARMAAAPGWRHRPLFPKIRVYKPA